MVRQVIKPTTADALLQPSLVHRMQSLPLLSLEKFRRYADYT